jgi:hypothetical protein
MVATTRRLVGLMRDTVLSPLLATHTASAPTTAQRFAEGVAERIDRRRFFRKAARSGFITLAALAAGRALDALVASPARAGCGATANGPGCPTGGHYGTAPCGPSRCCSYIRSGYPSTCNCGSGGSCTSGTTHCHGRAYYYSSGCWSCTGPAFACKTTGCYCRLKITCCDCATSGCGDSSGRCISWYTTTQLLGCAPTG